MPITVKSNYADGGAGINDVDSDGNKLADIVRGLIDDNTELRSTVTALLAKLDADGGVTDTDYASTLALADQEVTKG